MRKKELHKKEPSEYFFGIAFSNIKSLQKILKEQGTHFKNIFSIDSKYLLW